MLLKLERADFRGSSMAGKSLKNGVSQRGINIALRLLRLVALLWVSETP